MLTPLAFVPNPFWCLTVEIEADMERCSYAQTRTGLSMEVGHKVQAAIAAGTSRQIREQLREN